MARTKQVVTTNTDTDPNQVQQGDVVLQRLDKLPRGAKPVTENITPVIMEGEGHHIHTLASLEGVRFFTTTKSEGEGAEATQVTTRYMELDKPNVLNHIGINGGPGEHTTVTLDTGIWQIGQVFEFDPYLNLTRPVVD